MRVKSACSSLVKSLAVVAVAAIVLPSAVFAEKADRQKHKRASGYLESHFESDSRRQSRTDRRDRRDATNERLAHYQQTQRDMETARREALRLYAVYLQLSEMPEAQKRDLFPSNTYAETLRTTAIQYNNAVLTFRAAEERVAMARNGMTNGQSLSGSVVGELNALLGQ